MDRRVELNNRASATLVIRSTRTHFKHSPKTTNMKNTIK